MATLSAIRVNSKARDAEERQKQERRRNTLVLVMRHLLDSGYLGALERLQAESHVSLDRFDAADNIDLATIVQEFEEFHEMKFGRRPKLVRRVGPEDRGGGAETTGTGLPPPSRLPSLKSRPSSEEGGAGAPAPASGFTVARERRLRGQASQESLRQEALERRKQAMDAVQPPAEVGGVRVAGSVVDPRQGGPRPAGPAQGVESGGDLSLHATSMPLLPREADRGAVREGAGEEDPNEFFERRVLKPLPAYLQGESRELGLTITKDIFMESPDVRWEDIKGLSQAKRLLKEAVVMPIKYPELFTGILAPWKGILLYGPPGTGKTMLAKAVATECRTTFFNISASTIISKWRGESEKLVRVLFELARYHAPSTIFMDELDALMASRGGDGEHEASRRMKTEILVQMDGLARGKELVFVLAATNMPWELDMAMLRRLEKRIMVPLPEAEGRQAMLESLLGDRVALGVDLADVAARTEGFSGADMYLLAKEAAMRPLRRLMATIDISGDEGPKQALELERVAAGDLEGALSMTKPSAKAYEKQYRDFSDKYGVMAQ